MKIINYGYFRHRFDAHNDNKLMQIKQKHGLVGVGAYFTILEIYGLEFSQDCEKKIIQKIHIRRIANSFGSRSDLTLNLLKSMTSVGLLSHFQYTCDQDHVEIGVDNFLKYYGSYKKTDNEKVSNKRKEKKRKENKISNLQIPNDVNFNELNPALLIQKWNLMFKDRPFPTFDFGGGKHLENYTNSIKYLKTMSQWVEVFDKVKNTEFLKNNPRIPLTWVINYDNILDILAGKYDNEKTSDFDFNSLPDYD